MYVSTVQCYAVAVTDILLGGRSSENHSWCSVGMHLCIWVPSHFFLEEKLAKLKRESHIVPGTEIGKSWFFHFPWWLGLLSGISRSDTVVSRCEKKGCSRSEWYRDSPMLVCGALWMKLLGNLCIRSACKTISLSMGCTMCLTGRVGPYPLETGHFPIFLGPFRESRRPSFFSFWPWRRLVIGCDISESRQSVLSSIMSLAEEV